MLLQLYQSAAFYLISSTLPSQLPLTPLPSGLLRDIQARPLDLLHHRAQDNDRLVLFPNLDYLGLHQALVALVDVMPLIQSGTQGGY